MRSLSKKLKSLEAGQRPTEPEESLRELAELPSLAPLETRIDGQWWGTEGEKVLYAEEIYPETAGYGCSTVHLTTAREHLSEWMGLPEIASTPPSEMLFLDTETTGLAGGAGTYAFLVGLGWFTEQGFCLRQFFLRDPSEEARFLEVLEEQCAGKSLIVSFNGKSYDVPLLRTRFAMHKRSFPLDSLAHLDLLPLARRLWSNRLPSRRLRALETDILGVERSEEDIEGHLIPDVYFGFLRSGEIGQLPQVFHHNKMDMVAMVALLEHIAWLTESPLEGRMSHPEDLASLGFWLEQRKQRELALSLYETALKEALPGDLRLKVMEHLAILKKRDEDWNAAVALWIINATRGSVEAHVELAKYHEHRTRNFEEALRWTEKALALLRTSRVPRHVRFRWWDPLEHRRGRLLRKKQGLPVEEDESPDSLVHPSLEEATPHAAMRPGSKQRRTRVNRKNRPPPTSTEEES